LPRDTISGLKMYPKCFCGRGSAPNLDRGAHSTPRAPPDPLAEFRDRFTAGKEGEWEVRESGRREGEGGKGKVAGRREGEGEVKDGAGVVVVLQGD